MGKDGHPYKTMRSAFQAFWRSVFRIPASRNASPLTSDRLVEVSRCGGLSAVKHMLDRIPASPPQLPMVIVRPGFLARLLLQPAHDKGAPIRIHEAKVQPQKGERPEHDTARLTDESAERRDRRESVGLGRSPSRDKFAATKLPTLDFATSLA